MTQLPKDIYSLFQRVLDVLEIPNSEQGKDVEQFERVVFKEFSTLLMKKLPEQERKKIAQLANSAGNEGKSTEELEKKLSSWLNKEEVVGVYKKASERIFKEFLQEAFKDANEEQKKRLKEMFKAEAFEG